MSWILRPGEEKGTLIPTCGDCSVDLVLTTFENGITRWLCPKCGRNRYTRGMNTRRGYSIYIGEENDLE